MKKPLTLIACLIMLTACQAPNQQTAATPADTASTAQATPQTATANFTADSLYALLSAELAGQRDQPLLALEHYDRQAERTQDVQIAERAYRIADYMQETELALKNGLLWAQLAPDNAEAQRAAAIELAKAQQFDPALQRMERAMTLDPDGDNHFDFIAFAATHAQPSTQHALLQHFQTLLERYPRNPAVLAGNAILVQGSDPEQALHYVNRIASKHASPQILALQANLYQQLDQPEKSLDTLALILQEQPDNSQIRFNYARQLIGLNRLEDARAEFLTLQQQEQDNDDYRLALAYLNMDLEAWEEALVYLEDLISRGSFLDTAYYNLGRSLEALERPEEALSAYAGVSAGQFFLASLQRQAALYLQLEQLEYFDELFAQAHSQDPDSSAIFYRIEVEALSQEDASEHAWQRIQYALQQFPNDHSLLYTRAMIADERGDLAQLERDLRLIIANDPEHAIAMNALGYTLADRTERYTEALELIERAHQLAPDDAATLDSLGWVYYRLGDLEQARHYLEQSFAAFPDPEIAAHLGEVLWQQGKKRQARDIWRTALDNAPDHPVLLETLKRLDPRTEWFK